MPPSSSQREAGSAAQPQQQQVGKAGVLTSKFTGVCWNKKNKRWQASINSGGKYLYLGSFVQEDDAARMFDMAALKLRGQRTKTNFPLEKYLDENGELIENEELNSTIAVHEQLVLTQKMATAQALALAGLGTKKPRSAGGAGSVAKRMTKANPACQGIMSAAVAAAAGSAGCADGSVGGSAGAAAVPSLMDLQVLGQSIIAKHVSPEFDMPLLQQAATAAATSAALLQQQQQQQQARGMSMDQFTALSRVSSFGGLHAALTPHQQQQIAGVLGQVTTESLLHPITSVHSSTGLTFDGLLPTNWPAAGLPQEQQMTQQQQQQQLVMQQASAAAGLAVCQQPLPLHLPGDGMSDILQQQEATRALQLAALQGFVRDVQQQQQQRQSINASSRPGSVDAVGAQMQMQQQTQNEQQQQQQQQQHQLQYDWPFMPEQGAFAEAVDQAAAAAAAAAAAVGAPASTQAATAGMADMLHSGYPLPVSRGYQQQQGAVSAAVAASGSLHCAAPLSVVRLPQLACHLPPGSQLELLMVGEHGLCGVLYTMQDQQQVWGTALWDGALWHTGGGFASEAAAMQACEFAVKFARQLAHKAPGTQQQQQQHVGKPVSTAGHQAGSTEQLEERSSLDKLAAAAGQALDQLQQQHMQQPSSAQEQLQDQQHMQQHFHQQQQQQQHAKHRNSQKTHSRKQYHLPSSHPQHHVQAVRPGAGDAAAAAAEPVPPAIISAAKAAAAEAGRAADTHAAPAGCRPESGGEQGLPQRSSAKQVQQHLQVQQPQQQPAVPDEEYSLGSGLNSLLQLLQSDEVRSSLPGASLKVLDSLKAWGMGCAAALGGSAGLPDSGSAEALMFNILGSSSAAAFGQEAHLMMEQADAVGGSCRAAASQGSSPTVQPSKALKAPPQISMSAVGAGREGHSSIQQQQQLVAGSEAAQAAAPTAPAAQAAAGAGFDAYGAFGSSDGMAAALAAAAAALEEPRPDRKPQGSSPAGPLPDARGSVVVSAAHRQPGSNRSTAGPSNTAEHNPQHIPQPVAPAAAAAEQLLLAASVAGSSSAQELDSLVQLAPSLHGGSSKERAAGNAPVDRGAGELLSGAALGKLGAYLISLAEHEVQEQHQRQRSSSSREQHQAKRQRTADIGEQQQVDKTKHWVQQQQQQKGQMGDLAAVHWAAAAVCQSSPADDPQGASREATHCTAGTAAQQSAAVAGGAAGGAACACSLDGDLPPGILHASHMAVSSPRLRDQLLPEAPHSPEPGSTGGRAAGAGQLPAKVSLDSHSSGSSSLAVAAAAAVKAAAGATVLAAGSSKVAAAGQAAAADEAADEAAFMEVDDHPPDGATLHVLTAPAGGQAAGAAASGGIGDGRGYGSAAAAAGGGLDKLPDPLSSRLTDTLTELLSQGVNVQQVLALLSNLPQQQQQHKQQTSAL